MPNFQIVDVEKKKAGDPGTWVAYSLRLQPPDSDPTDQILCEYTTSQNAPPPTRGESVSGRLEDSKWGLKFVKDKKGGGSRNGRATDPKDAARMGRAHAQEMALRYAAVKAHMDQLPAFGLPDLKGIINWFEKDVDAAVPAPAPVPLPDKPSDIPPPAPAPQMAPAGGDDVPF